MDDVSLLPLTLPRPRGRVPTKGPKGQGGSREGAHHRPIGASSRSWHSLSELEVSLCLIKATNRRGRYIYSAVIPRERRRGGGPREPLGLTTSFLLLGKETWQEVLSSLHLSPPSIGQGIGIYLSPSLFWS